MVVVTVDDARQAVRLLRRSAQNGMTVLQAPEVVVTADVPEIPVGVDGEALLLPTPVRCTIRPKALRVRVPHDRPGVCRGHGRIGTWLRSSGWACSPGPGRRYDMDMTTLRQSGREVVVLDRAVYEAVHATPSPTLDRGVALVSRAADHSKIWLSIAAVMAVAGERPRKAALVGFVAVGVTSALVNVAVKPRVRRERPSTLRIVRTHVVRMPTSASYPSGHAASTFACSTAVGGGMPELDTALRVGARTARSSHELAAPSFPRWHRRVARTKTALTPPAVHDGPGESPPCPSCRVGECAGGPPRDHRWAMSGP